MNNDVEIIETTVLPKLFADPDAIGRYGDLQGDNKSMSAYAELMESAPVAGLAAQLALIVTKLADADPQKVAMKPNWWQRMTGVVVESAVRYQVAREELEKLLAAAQVRVGEVRLAVGKLDELLSLQTNESTHLDVHLKAGRQFLAANPKVGIPEIGLSFDNPRERFARKLANLATLHASHEMSMGQLKLTRAQAVDMIDRFSEISSVLVPVWRQHTLALINTKNMSPEMLAQAKKAHEALMYSLSQTNY